MLCQLATEEDDTAAQTLVKHMGVPPTQYHLNVLRKVFGLHRFFAKFLPAYVDILYMLILFYFALQTVALVQDNIGKSCSSLGDLNQR